MSKKSKFAELSLAEASAKRQELVKSLLKFRVSLDASALESSSATSIPTLQRDLRALGRIISAGQTPAKK